MPQDSMRIETASECCVPGVIRGRADLGLAARAAGTTARRCRKNRRLTQKENAVATSVKATIHGSNTRTIDGSQGRSPPAGSAG